MRNFGKHVGRAVSIAALLVGGAAVAAPAAQATPYNCSGVYELNTWQVYCGGGSGQFRAKARCYKIGSSSYVTRYGVWRYANGGLRSVVSCYSSEEVASGGWELR
ncbi:hypothetical protein [Kribbella sp. NPDC023855]|uniref:hypothetical protein n=1 Tax=Kribbella sp. NPDC023855 TaxID=3154698 RepID=UPI0033DC0C2A